MSFRRTSLLGKRNSSTTRYSFLTQKFPEYLLTEPKIEMPQFKRIWFVEWAHRAWGNCIGLMFGVPMIYFWARGYFKRKMKLRMLGLLALGGTQGLIGWWMVKSGLMPKPGYQTEPRVHKTSSRFLSIDCSFI